MKVEFECIICGERATAAVDGEQVGSGDGPLRTLRDCPSCGIETIWLER